MFHILLNGKLFYNVIPNRTEIKLIHSPVIMLVLTTAKFTQDCSSFYSCKLQTYLSKMDLRKLEYTQRHFSMIIQGLYKCCSSLTCTSIIDLWSLYDYIDKHRFLFLGRLARAEKMFIKNIQFYHLITFLKKKNLITKVN